MTRRRPSLTSIFRGFSLITLAMIAVNAPAQTVTTPGGTFTSETYVGVVVNGTTDFLGIRYSAAPVGNLRFSAPTPPPADSSTIAATQFGSSCPQPPSPFGKASVDEDCLFLNIFVPNPPVSANASR